jgi:hypothetical protein
VERALLALISEPSIKAAARAAHVSEKDLRGWMVYAPFRALYNQYRRAFNVMRTAMGYPEAPELAELIQKDRSTRA